MNLATCFTGHSKLALVSEYVDAVNPELVGRVPKINQNEGYYYQMV